jgi:hypothetical protein
MALVFCESCAGNSDLKWPQTLKGWQYSRHYTHNVMFTFTVLNTSEEHVDCAVNKGLSNVTSEL